jgi:hypothetical protein
MTIDPTISNYIDVSINTTVDRISKITDQKIEAIIDRAEKTFKEEQDHHLDALKEFFEDKMKVITEYCSSFPTEEKVRSIVREEVAPLEMKITLITDEIIEHRRTLYKHDKRLTKLENVVV